MTPIRLPKYLFFTVIILLLFSCKNDEKDKKPTLELGSGIYTIECKI